MSLRGAGKPALVVVVVVVNSLKSESSSDNFCLFRRFDATTWTEVQVFMNENITVQTEDLPAKCTLGGILLFGLQRFVARETLHTLGLILAGLQLFEQFHRKQVMEGASQMGGRHQSQTANMTPNGQVAVFGLTLGTKVATMAEVGSLV